MTSRNWNLPVFLADQRAVAVVEFALLLPFLVLLLFGGIAVTDAVTARRKVAQAAGSLSDLIAQEECVNDSFINNAFSVAEAIIAPLAANQLKATVSLISIDPKDNATVTWSRPRNTTARKVGESFPLSNNMAALKGAGVTRTFVIAETAYDYKPVIGYGISGTVAMRDTTFALPRSAPAATGIPYQASGCN